MKKILLLLCCVCFLFVLTGCDDDDDDDKYMQLGGTSWTFTITTPDGYTYPGVFSISSQDEGSIGGFGTLEIAYINAEFNLSGSIDTGDNINMLFDLLDAQWVDMSIYGCKCAGNTMNGLARSSNWTNATFHATKR